jgi:hypothetical protein
VQVLVLARGGAVAVVAQLQRLEILKQLQRPALPRLGQHRGALLLGTPLGVQRM